MVLNRIKNFVSVHSDYKEKKIHTILENLSLEKDNPAHNDDTILIKKAFDIAFLKEHLKIDSEMSSI